MATFRLIALLAFALLLSLPRTGEAQKRQPKSESEFPYLAKDHSRDWQGYVPSNPAYFPIQRIRLVFHVIQKDDGTANFQDLPEDRQFMQKILDYMDWVMWQADTPNSWPKEMPRAYVADARIRFVLDTVFYHRSTADWNYRERACSYDPVKKDTFQNNGKLFRFAEELHQKYVEKNPVLTPQMRDSSLNVFLLEAKDMGGRGMAHNLHSKKWLVTTGAYHHYQAPGGPNHWGPGLVMLHEVLHDLGLAHPFDWKQCPDLVLSDKGSTNNVMDSHPGQGTALTPCQIGTVQLGLHGHQGDLRDILVRDWCVRDPNATMHIQPGDTVRFEGDRYLTGDLVIHPGAVLIVRCKLSMPPQGVITVMPKGAFIIEGGEVFNACGEKWGGIRLEKNRKGLFGEKKSRSLFQVFHDGAFYGSEDGIMKVKF